MAVRLHMNLGLVAESQRLPDSADTVVIVEPNLGSTSRTKGSLFLLVTGAGGRKLREATKTIAGRIRDDYYYDLSAGISVCLRKAVRAANNMLLHSPDRPAVAPGEAGPIGLALAVVRGNELYVATLGPAEAYMVRQARLLTLPDTGSDRGMPADDMDGPEVWHGEIAAGDCLILISPNVTRRIGLGPIQDAVLQLHPQAAVEQIHRQFGSSSLGSTGGDGILFVEATEVASTHKATPLKPVWPGESLAGAPERSPIPLADAVVGGVATMQTTARHAQVAADGWLRRRVYGLFDHMPERPMSRGRITPIAARRERRQRTAVAVVGLLAVVAIVGTGMWFFASATRPNDVPEKQTSLQAYAKASADIDAVYGSGRHLMDSDPETAAIYLKDAYKELAIAEQNGYPPELLTDPRAQVIAGLNQYYNVTIIQPKVVYSFATDDLEALIQGPDGAAYVLDSTVDTVYRVNLQTGARVPVVAVKQEPPVGGGTVGNPHLLAVGGGDLLVLDSFNSLWRWHPSAGDTTGRGVLVKVSIEDNATWGVGARAIGTFVINAVKNQYNFYIVIPSQQQVLKYPPAIDGSSYPKAGRANYLSVAQDVSTVDDMYVDGRVYLVDKGKITQYELGQAVKSWKVGSPPDTLGDVPIRSTPVYTRMASDSPDQDQGNFYAYDVKSQRIVGFKKLDGSIVGSYMAPPNTPWFSDLKGMFVTTGTGGINPTLYWVESGNLMSASLTPSSTPTPTASSSVGPSGSHAASPKVSAPTLKP